MSRLVVVLALFFAIACSQETPTQQSTLDSEVGPWETIEVNGALYRRAAAKPTETGQADLLITIPIGYTVSSGAVRFSDTVTIAGRVYTADCGICFCPRRCGQHDGGGHRANRADAHLGGGRVLDISNYFDSDYFKLRVTQFRYRRLVRSRWSVGKLMTSSGRVIFENDNAEGVEPNFTVWAFGIRRGRCT